MEFGGKFPSFDSAEALNPPDLAYLIKQNESLCRKTLLREEMTVGEVGGGTHFNAEIASVYVAPKEEVAGIGGMAAELEQCHEIILRYGKLTGSDRTNCSIGCGKGAHVLTENVTADCDQKKTNV